MFSLCHKAQENYSFVYYGPFMSTASQGLGRMKVGWLYVFAKIGLEEPLSVGFTE